jgi:hypothetical protein
MIFSYTSLAVAFGLLILHAQMGQAVAASTDEPRQTPLNITALSSRNGYSVLECWQLDSVPFSFMAATNYVLGETTKATWSRIEPRAFAGESWAPTVQYVSSFCLTGRGFSVAGGANGEGKRITIILNGMIRITSPAPLTNNASVPIPGQDGSGDRPEEKVAYLVPGTVKSSVLVAADLKALSTVAGHFTEFPGNEPTVLVQVPFDGNRIPVHEVLYEGGCV